MNHLVKTYLMPHAPILIPIIAESQAVHCQKTITAMQQIGNEIATIKPKRIIIISPHGTVFTDGVAVLNVKQLHGDLADFGDASVTIDQPCDCEFVKHLEIAAFERGIVVAPIDTQMAADFDIDIKLDYGAVVPLWFINQYYSAYQLVHITYGLLPVTKLYQLGMALSELCAELGEDSVLIASGDLSHAHHMDGVFASEYDQWLCQMLADEQPLSLLASASPMRQRAQLCAFRSLAMMYGALDGRRYQAVLHSYQQPFGVGYAVASFEVDTQVTDSLLMPLKQAVEEKKVQLRANEDDYIKLARYAVECVVNEQTPDPTRVAQFKIADQTNACFISLTNESGLRGCIGTTSPRFNSLKREIIHNAQLAATNDPRFESVSADELADLWISVDVLSTPERVSDRQQLDPQKYGIIVIKDHKQGVLLPDLEGIDTVEDQIAVAKNKASITGTDYQLSRFSVERHCL